jgi:electron transfer flavoprotein alpha subunit
MVLVLVEQTNGGVSDLSLQALTLARSLASGRPLHALLFGPGGHDAADALGAYGVGIAHVADHGALADPEFLPPSRGEVPRRGGGGFAPDAWARILGDLADRLEASAVVAAGSERGNDVLARLAARSGLPLAANCVAANAGPPVTVTRLRWGGSLLEEAVLHAPRALLTSAPHAVTAEPVAEAVATAVEPFTPDLDEADLVCRVREHVAAAGTGVSLAEAKVVVSGGRGVGSAEGFAVIEELASLLGGAVGCSRAVTSAGWRPHTDQVGQTGTKIAPELYIPCGISGATQHMAGCRDANKILAINADPEAPIMATADYAVIGDLLEIVPAISAEVRKLREG